MARTKPIHKDISKQILNKNNSNKKVIEDNIIFIPTPSTLLNCSCTDSYNKGLKGGTIVNIIGDSSSGKSILALSILAEMNKYSKFDNYRFIYDDVENANSFDMEYLFGSETADRIEPPAVNEDDEDLPSDTIEDFHCNISDVIDKEIPFVYILDSFDALDSEQDQDKIKEMKKAKKENKKAKGSYGMSKPKKASEILRNIKSGLSSTDSILIVISQTRDNIDPTSFEKKTRSGGKALKFYCTHEIWLAMAGKIKSKDRVIGNKVKAKITKNKITGKVREVSFPIFYDYGVDDIRSCIEFMEKETFWKKKKLTIQAKELKIEGTQSKLIKQIENKNLENKLSKIVGKRWLEIEESLKLNRKSKY